MPQTVYKGYEVQTTGSNSGSWGTVLNEDALEIIDRNLGGVLEKSLSSSPVVLTSEESEYLIVRLTGTLSANVQVTTSAEGITIVENLTSGAFDVTFTDGVASAVTLPQSLRSIVLTDSTNGARLFATAPADNSVDTAQLVDGAVTWAKLAQDIFDQSTVSPATNDKIPFSDTSDSGNRKVATVSALLALASAASDSAAGVIEIAVQSEMEAASSTTLAVTPGRQQFHPGHPKAGGNFNGTGTPAFRSGDYGMGAITDNGTGNYTLALDTAFSNTNYWVTGWARGSTVNASVSADSGDTKTTSSFQVRTAHHGADNVDADSSEVGIAFWGDYA